MLDESIVATQQQKSAADQVDTAIQQISVAADSLAAEQTQRAATADGWKNWWRKSSRGCGQLADQAVGVVVQVHDTGLRRHRLGDLMRVVRGRDPGASGHDSRALRARLKPPVRFLRNGVRSCKYVTMTVR
jgi:hypothetical protein